VSRSCFSYLNLYKQLHGSHHSITRGGCFDMSEVSSSNSEPQGTLGKVFLIGEWRIYQSLNRISTGEQTVQLQPLVMQVLVHLASRPGEVFTRSQLLATVWKDTVVGEEVLTRVISVLRRTFKDSAASPRYIETIRKEGYRLIAPVQPVLSPVSGTWRTWITQRVAFLLVCLLLVISTTAIVLSINSSESTEPILLSGIPLTAFPGQEHYPALSPDGQRTAFSWESPESESLDIYVTQKDTAAMLRLTEHEAEERYPAWSPDGTMIAFVRETTPEAICLIPSIGGEIRTVNTSESGFYTLDWSPDGESLVYSAADSVGGVPYIHLLHLSTDTVTALLEPEPKIEGYLSPVYSGDGKRIAFLRINFVGFHEVCWMSVQGGDVHVLTTERRVSGLDWTADNNRLVYSAMAHSNYGLWQIPVDGGPAQPMVTRSGSAIHPSIASQTDQLAYEEQNYRCNIYRMTTTDEVDPPESSSPFIHSTRTEYGGRYSPDGTKIAYVSMRSGRKAVWICDADGSNPYRVTHLDSADYFALNWSPDGQQIAFSANETGYYRIYLAPVDGGPEICLPATDQHQFNIDWSADGQIIYYMTNLEEEWQTWRRNADGSEPEPVAPMGWRLACVAPDGANLYFMRPDESGIWLTDLAGENATCAVDSAAASSWRFAVPISDGYFVLNRDDDELILSRYSETSGELKKIAAVPEGTYPALGVSPDEKFILLDVFEDIETDLILVENMFL
jgi:Tol biopolymer transport system component/DNA-binding winged helix-turn-helix (wHTH) protein